MYECRHATSERHDKKDKSRLGRTVVRCQRDRVAIPSQGHTVPSDEKSIALLTALPPSWGQWVQLMESRATDSNALSFITICNLVTEEEQRRQADGSCDVDFDQADRQDVCVHCWDKGRRRRARAHTRDKCVDPTLCIAAS